MRSSSSICIGQEHRWVDPLYCTRISFKCLSQFTLLADRFPALAGRMFICSQFSRYLLTISRGDCSNETRGLIVGEKIKTGSNQRTRYCKIDVWFLQSLTDDIDFEEQVYHTTRDTKKRNLHNLFARLRASWRIPASISASECRNSNDSRTLLVWNRMAFTLEIRLSQRVPQSGFTVRFGTCSIKISQPFPPSAQPRRRPKCRGALGDRPARPPLRPPLRRGQPKAISSRQEG